MGRPAGEQARVRQDGPLAAAGRRGETSEPAGPVAPRWPDYKFPATHPRLFHPARYNTKNPADVAYGDSLEAIHEAATKGYTKRDLNILATSDLVPIGNHSSVLSSHLGGGFTHRYVNEWGVGDPILDPNRDKGVGARTWADVSLVTDATGERRIHTLEEHIVEGIKLGVMTFPESKPQEIQERVEFWHNVREVCERHGHPFQMMTLTNYGRPFRRCAAAKSATSKVWPQGAWTALLPRGDRPAGFDEYGRPYVDALWGTAWGAL